MVLGDNEILNKKAKLKDMNSGNETEISLDESFIDNFSNEIVSKLFDTQTVDENIKF